MQAIENKVNCQWLCQEKLSEAVGKSRPAIANTLRILNLPEEILPLVSSGKLSAGHAKAILSAPEEKRAELAKMIVDAWLTGEYEGGRHQVRIDMLKEIEERQK